MGGTGLDEDEDAWLSFALESTWEEWDGYYLNDCNRGSVFVDYDGYDWDSIDPGATT